MEGNGTRQQNVSCRRAGLNQPVGLPRFKRGADETGSAVKNADRSTGECLIVIDRESRAIERIGSIIVLGSDRLGAGLLDADR